MKHNHRYSVLTTLTLLLWSASSFAQLSIPPDVMDAITQNGTARIIVRLDVPFTPEGYLSEAQIQAQRQQIANTQTQFETTLETTLDSMGGAIDDASGGSGTARVDVEVRTFASVPLVALEVDGQTLLAMRQDDSIKNIHLNTPDFANLNSSLGAIGADVVHQKGYQGKGQVIAIMDSGITHPTLEDKIVAEGCFSTTNAPATASSICPPDLKEFDEGTGRACDSAVSRCEHGTNVGLVAAATAPQAKLAAMQIYTEFADEFMCIGLQEPCARSYQDDQIAALGHLMDLKKEGLNLTVVNLSLNDREKQIGSCDDDPRKEIIDNLLSYGVVTVVSAGNQDYEDGVSAPACISSVVAVGATDSQGNIANFSNHGSEMDLLAPGVMTIDGQVVQGTSFAAPMVTGSYAVLKAAHPNKGIDEILAMLKNTGQDVDGTPLIQLDAALSQTSCDIVPEGQVACYPFSGNAKDYSGNKHDGKVNGATLTTDRSENTDSAYNFDGDDFVQFDSPVQAEPPFSVSLWFNYAALPSNSSYLIANGAESRNSQGFYVFIDATGALRFGIGQESLNFKMSVVTSNPISLNQWHHVTGTWDGTTDAENLKLYLDGQLAEVEVTPGNTFFGPPRNLMIGIPSNGDSDYSGKGQIDDVIIYNRVLSDSEVKQLAGIEEKPVDPSCEVVKDGLVGCYPFPKNANDYSGNGNDGTVNGVTLTEDRFGNPDSAYYFDGQGFINLGNSPQFDVNHHTITAWIKGEDLHLNRPNVIMGKVNPKVHETIMLALKRNLLSTNFATDTEVNHHLDGSIEFESDQWYFVALTYDGEEATLYVDGNVDSSVSRTGTVRTNSNDLAIGRHGGDLDQQGHEYPFHGSIDEVRLYNRALSEAEIQTLYNLGDENITSCTQWNPKTDYLALSQPENPYRDSCGNQGVWHMMESEKLERNPQSYSLLSRYTNEGLYTNDGIGIYHWSGSFSINGKSYRPLARIEQVFGMHPAPNQLAVLGWQSPVDGTVEITGFVKNTKDGGTTWFLDQETTNLASGEVIDGAIQLFKKGANTDLNHIDVRKGEFLYFVIDPRSAPNSCFAQGISNCDSTRLDISINLVEDNQPSENSLTVNKAGEGRGTLRAKPKGENWNLVCQSDCSEASEIYPVDSQVILTASPEKGFLFNGWAGDCTGTEKRLTFTMNGAKTCIAQFEPDTSNSALLTVNTDGTGQGSVISTDGYINCGLDCSEFYRLDKRVTLEATPNADNLFLGWSGNCSGIKNPVRVTMDAAKNCTATFKPKLTGALTLSVDKQGEGQAVITGLIKGEEQTLSCDKNCQQASYDYAAGDQVLLSARALKGFIFKEWTGDCSGTEPRITVLMDDAKNCTAQIDLDPNVIWYQLTINNVGTGKGRVTASGSDCTETRCTLYYQPDKVVRLTATRALFSEFVGWSGDCEGTKTAKLTMTKDLICTAEFKSEFEILVEQMVDAFYANATLDNGDSVATQYPQNADNRERLKEAFWLNLATLMQTDQHLGLSNGQDWPEQFNGTEWLPPNANTEYTESIQIQSQDFVGIKVELLNTAGQTQTIPVIIYYSDAMPVIDDGGGWYSARSVYFSRYVVPTWW
jgi:hypothetical protein